MILLPADYLLGMLFFDLSVANTRQKGSAIFVVVIFPVDRYLNYTQI